MLTVDEQLSTALAEIAQLKADAAASAELLVCAETAQETLRAKTISLEADVDRLNADLAAKQNLLDASEASAKVLGDELEALKAKDQDIETRASAMAASIVASTGTREPVKIAPKTEAEPKTCTRDQFDAMSDQERVNFFRSGGRITV